jgi:MFS family permease
MLYFPPASIAMNALLMFIMGVVCTVYIFNFSLMNDVAPVGARTTAFGLTNALCCLSAPLLQTLIGWLLDYESQGTQTNDIYIAAHYHWALAILPILLLFAVWLAYQLPIKRATSSTPKIQSNK